MCSGMCPATAESGSGEKTVIYVGKAVVAALDFREPFGRDHTTA